jgi:hypothetical protein
MLAHLTRTVTSPEHGAFGAARVPNAIPPPVRIAAFIIAAREAE